MTFAQLIIALFAIAFSVTLLLPKLYLQKWWCRMWNYPRPALCFFAFVHGAVSLAAMGLPVTFLHGLVAIELALAVLALSDLLPFFPVWPKTIADAGDGDARDGAGAGEKLSVLLFNVHQLNDQYDDALAMLRASEADIIFLCETSQKWREKLAPLEVDYPHHYLLPSEQCNGLLFYSRLEILSVTEDYLSQDHIPSLFISLRTNAGKQICFNGLHPRPPRPEDATINLDLELQRSGERIAEQSCPVLAGGDLNEVSWSPAFKMFLRKARLFDPRIGRGFYHTFDARKWYVFWPIDHLLMSQHFRMETMQRLGACGSDHHAMKYDLRLITA